MYSSRRGSRDIEHIGSAHDDAELELLRAVARQWLAVGQGELDLGLGFGGRAGAGRCRLLPLVAAAISPSDIALFVTRGARCRRDSGRLRARRALTTKPDHNRIRQGPIPTDASMAIVPGERQHATTWAYFASRGSGVRVSLAPRSPQVRGALADLHVVLFHLRARGVPDPVLHTQICFT